MNNSVDGTSETDKYYSLAKGALDQMRRERASLEISTDANLIAYGYQKCIELLDSALRQVA
jgi:hypothetical protein